MAIVLTFKEGNKYLISNTDTFYQWFNMYSITPRRYRNGILYATADQTATEANYSERKEAARQFAIDAQNIIRENNFSYGEIAEISDTLHALGKRFGLVREFKENCIC